MIIMPICGKTIAIMQRFTKEGRSVLVSCPPMAWPLAEIVVGVDHTHPPPPFPILQLFLGHITSIWLSHPWLGPVLGHTGRDWAGAKMTVTKRMTSSQPTISNTVPWLSALLPLFQLCHTLDYCNLHQLWGLRLALIMHHFYWYCWFIHFPPFHHCHLPHSQMSDQPLWPPQFLALVPWSHFSHIFSLSPWFSLMDAPHIVYCKAGDDGHQEQSGLVWLG